MATIFKGYRPRIARQMAAGDAEIMRWLGAATFAKASSGHWMAWRDNSPDWVAVLPPGGQPCQWIETWGENDTIEDAIEFVESGRFDTEGPAVLNLFIENLVTGKWE